MSIKKRVLFIGNGVALRMGAAKSWDKIIADLAEQYSPQTDSGLLKKLPYNMQIVAATHDNVDKSMVEL